MATVTALGLMSGTSLDGIDAALIETDGERVARFGPVGYRPYAEGERDVLRRALAAATALTDRAARPGVLAEAEALVTQAHGQAAEDFLRTHGLDRKDIAVIGFHGQTVLHRPEQRLTIQIGDGTRWRGASACRWCSICAPPTSPPAGRGRRSCRCSTARW